MFKKFAILFCFIAIILNFLIIKYVDGDRSGSLGVTLQISSTIPQTYQVFYSKDGNWTEEQSMSQNNELVNTQKSLEYTIPNTSNFVRLDLGSNISYHQLTNLVFSYKKQIYTVDNFTLENVERNMINSLIFENDIVNISTIGNDPYIILDLNSLGIKDSVLRVQNKSILEKNIFMCLFIDILLLIIYKFRKVVISIPVELYRNRKLILKLAKNDFKTKYAGSYFGILWAFVQPIVTILTYWFVFQVGLKSGPISNYPFVLWLIAGLIPWFFFSDALNSGMNSLIEYSYLVKKVVFNITILPVIKIFSALFIHIFFLIFMLLLFTLSGYVPGMYALQIIYYSFCILILTLSISYITSSLLVFFRDLSQLINIILQIGMWMTPILWNYTMIPDRFLWIFKMNPMYYIVEGFRNSLIYKIWFWENINSTIYFWGITGALFTIGSIIFKRLRVHFADVL